MEPQMVGDSLASDTAIDEAVITEGQQHSHRELAVGRAGLRDRLQHNGPHAAKMARMGCQVRAQGDETDRQAQHSLGWGLHRRGSGSSGRHWDTVKVPAASGEVTCAWQFPELGAWFWGEPCQEAVVKLVLTGKLTSSRK